MANNGLGLTRSVPLEEKPLMDVLGALEEREVSPPDRTVLFEHPTPNNGTQPTATQHMIRETVFIGSFFVKQSLPPRQQPFMP